MSITPDRLRALHCLAKRNRPVPHAADVFDLVGALQDALDEVQAQAELIAALVDACRCERDELAADQLGSRSPHVREHYGRRISRMDKAIADATGKDNSPQ